MREGQCTVAVPLVENEPTQVEVGVLRTPVAVVEDQRPAGQVRAGRSGDLDGFVGVRTDVVVVNLVDEYRRARRLRL